MKLFIDHKILHIYTFYIVLSSFYIILFYLVFILYYPNIQLQKITIIKKLQTVTINLSTQEHSQ